ncbi:MAG: hypothetical protein DMF80_10095 [Acidobacteria bacterium]|nr:MAG: hypothetical protein DMF80_10095 [Acidobacteriota bacterium]
MRGPGTREDPGAGLTEASYGWRLEAPPSRVIDAGEFSGLGPWFAEVWALRGEIFYDEGRRPGFDLSGRWLDPDPLDLYSYHVLAHGPRGVVGCVRVLPLSSAPPGLTESLLGHQRFERMLQEIGASSRHTAEAGRWGVHPDRRAQGRHLGCGTALAPAGTSDGQDRILARIGLRPVPGLEPLRSELFTDEVRLMYAILDEPSRRFKGLIDQMAAILGIGRGG